MGHSKSRPNCPVKKLSNIQTLSTAYRKSYRNLPRTGSRTESDVTHITYVTQIVQVVTSHKFASKSNHSALFPYRARLSTKLRKLDPTAPEIICHILSPCYKIENCITLLALQEIVSPCPTGYLEWHHSAQEICPSPKRLHRHTKVEY